MTYGSAPERERVVQLNGLANPHPGPKQRRTDPLYFRAVKARTKFLCGGLVVLGSAGYLMASSIRSTGVYYLTPSELAARTTSDPTFYETGVKVGGRVVPHSIVRTAGGRETSFKMTDGPHTYSVVYHGITPDTFTDSVDVVVEGRLGHDQTFRATTLLAKCASRYETPPSKDARQSWHQNVAQNTPALRR